MPLYDVLIHRTYSGYKVIEAESFERAEEYAWAQLVNKTIDPTDFDCQDEVEVIEEIDNA